MTKERGAIGTIPLTIETIVRGQGTTTITVPRPHVRPGRVGKANVTG